MLVPYEPFPGSIGVLPSLETVKMKLDHHGAETTKMSPRTSQKHPQPPKLRKNNLRSGSILFPKPKSDTVKIHPEDTHKCNVDFGA